MREQLWNARLASTQHFRWYRNLSDIHALTRSWLTEDESKSAFPAQSLPFPETAAMLAGLDSQAAESDDSRLNRILDDTNPDDTLGRLDLVVNTVQATTAARAGSTEALREASEKSGAAYGVLRWRDADEGVRGNLRGILSLMDGAPLFGQGSFLVHRSTVHELSTELLRCPHTSSIREVQAQADRLCELHSCWLRGYLKSLNPSIQLEYKARDSGDSKSQRCLMKWALP